MIYRIFNYFIALTFLITPWPVLACAVCYSDNGMSGASIALIVIVSSFLVLFFANRFFKKILNKN